MTRVVTTEISITRTLLPTTSTISAALSCVADCAGLCMASSLPMQLAQILKSVGSASSYRLRLESRSVLYGRIVWPCAWEKRLGPLAVWIVRTW